MTIATDPRPLILSLRLDAASFARLDALRRAHFPPARNFIPAHLTMFHDLPGDSLADVTAALEHQASATSPLSITFGEPFRLSGGFAVRVESPGLHQVRGQLAREFAPLLSPQDRQPYRPHVTLMNKAERQVAAAAFDTFRSAWEPIPGVGEALLLWAYEGGPWRPLGQFLFHDVV